MQNSYNLKRFRAGNINHKTGLSDGPEVILFVDEVRTPMPETGIVCKHLARGIDVGLELVGRRGIFPGNSYPDLLNIVPGFR